MPKTTRIANENNAYQLLDTLKRNRKKRVAEGLFFVEGVQAVNFALQYGWQIDTFAYAWDKPLSGWAQDILKNSRAVQHIEMPTQLMAQLSDKEEETSELIAAVKMRDNNLNRIAPRDNPLILVFDRPSSHGNLGTILRSCEALKADGLVITGHAVDLYDPKVIRASMGTFFAVPAVRLPSQNELTAWFSELRQRYPGFQIVGTSSKGTMLLEESELSLPTALLIGNETWGLSAAYKELCDKIARIPMYGNITSFNVSCAASIMLYEADRQRRQK